MELVDLGKRIGALRKFLGMTQEQFARIMETTQNNVSLIENGKNLPTAKQIEHLARKVHANSEWLSSGYGQMFSLDNIPHSLLTAEQLDKIIAHTSPTTKAVPFFEKPIEGMGETSFADTQKYTIDFLPFNDCSFYRPVFGESMSPKFNRGDIVACKKITNREYISYGQPHLCMFRRGNETIELLRTVRRGPDSMTITLVPTNPDYDSITIPLADVESIFIIKGRIERYFQ